MDEYKSNSNKTKPAEREKRVEKAVSGKVKRGEKSEWQKVWDLFIVEDAQSVWSTILKEVIVPGIKKVFIDMVTNGLSMRLYGGTAKSSGAPNASRVSYSAYYNDGRSVRREDQPAGKLNYDNIVLESKGEAEEVLNQMFGCLEKYGNVSVVDLYDLLGIDGDYTETKYGWTNLQNAYVARDRDGYRLKLPKARPLN